jgi:protein TonB
MPARTYDSGYTQRRMVAFAAIVAVHLLIAWAFVSGFAADAIHQFAKDVQVSLIKPDDVKDTPPPPPKEVLDRPPPVAVPPPLITINMPTEAPPIVVTDRPAPPPPRPMAVVPATPVQFARVLDTADYYPAQSQRLEEQGSTVIRSCVLPTGKLESTPQVLTSSNFERLDQAAVKYASDTRYKPAISEGKPIRACKDFRVTFKMTNAR